MKTDKQFYKLFSELPDYFFDLTEIHHPAQYKFRSETIKEFSRSMDGLMEPDNPNAPHISVISFQLSVFSYQWVVVYNLAGTFSFFGVCKGEAFFGYPFPGGAWERGERLLRALSREPVADSLPIFCSY